jgi:hypothetical protein
MILNYKRIKELAKRTELTEQEKADLKDSFEALKVAIDKAAECLSRQGIELEQASINMTKNLSGLGMKGKQ